MDSERKLSFVLNIVLGFIVVITREIIPEPISNMAGISALVFAICNMSKLKNI